MTVQQIRDLAKQVDPTVEIDDDVANVRATLRGLCRAAWRVLMPTPLTAVRGSRARRAADPRRCYSTSPTSSWRR